MKAWLDAARQRAIEAATPKLAEGTAPGMERSPAAPEVHDGAVTAHVDAIRRFLTAWDDSLRGCYTTTEQQEALRVLRGIGK
jgi:hypothetical protein